MNKCPKCNLTIHSSTNICPLCHSIIPNFTKDTIFPEIKSKYKAHDLLLRIIIILSICGTTLSLFINYTINKHLSWSIFVILGILSFWFTFITGIKRRKDYIKLLFSQLLCIIILAIFWDYYTGFYKWSLTYVLPLTCIAYTTTFIIMRIFTNKVNKDYIIYTYLNSLIGLFPLYFILTKYLKVLWPSFISVILSILALAFLFIFNHKTLENEIERRFHI